MRSVLSAVVWLLLVLPGFAMAQMDGSSQGSSDMRGPDGPPWLMAQGPPPQPAPPGSPPPKPPRGMGPGGPWWKNSQAAKRLELSEAQVAEIEKTVVEYRLQMVDLRATLDKEELRLQPMLDADRPDEAKVAAQLDLIIAARGKLDKANALMMLAIRRTLSPEQWRKLQGLQQEREGARGRPGEETPGRPAPPPSRRGSADAPPPR